MRVDWAGRRALLRRAAWPIAQTAIGAGTAWAIARYALGHKQPFFAPIAATISLGWTVGRRARKAVQLMTGVAVGIVIADLVVAVIGTGALQIAAVVTLAMFAALLVSRSPLLVNQAGASAILVMALHRPHSGSQRLLDALVGGAVAILIGAVIFPADPRRLVADAARGVLEALADGLERVGDALMHPEHVVSGWSLDIAQLRETRKLIEHSRRPRCEFLRVGIFQTVLILRSADDILYCEVLYRLHVQQNSIDFSEFRL